MSKGTFLTQQGIRGFIYSAERTAYVCGALTADGKPVNCRKVSISHSARFEKEADECGFYARPIYGFPGYYLLLNLHECEDDRTDNE